jgi:hypothetical protein
MIIILGHASTLSTLSFHVPSYNIQGRELTLERSKACPYVLGDVDGTVRSSVQALRASQYLRKDISVMGSVLDLVAVQTANGPASTAKMREV